MSHVTCRLTAKSRDQLRNPTLGSRVWATFTFYLLKAKFHYTGPTGPARTRADFFARPRPQTRVSDKVRARVVEFSYKGSSRTKRAQGSAPVASAESRHRPISSCRRRDVQQWATAPSPSGTVCRTRSVAAHLAGHLQTSPLKNLLLCPVFLLALFLSLLVRGSLTL